MKVFKYPIDLDDVTIVHLPFGAQILRVDIQNGVCVLWALVDDAHQSVQEQHTIRIAGTGHPITIPPEKLRYINTFYPYDDKSLVYHAFEVIT